MTPQEILEEADDRHSYDLGMKTVTERAALEAMDEYAKQEAIGFAGYIGRVLNQEIILPLNKENFTSHEELYNLYQLSQK